MRSLPPNRNDRICREAALPDLAASRTTTRRPIRRVHCGRCRYRSTSFPGAGNTRCASQAPDDISLRHMATYRTTAVLLSADGVRTPGTAALFTEPAGKGDIAPWAGDFRPATDAAGIKVVTGMPLMLELPDGRSGKVVVQSVKRGKGGVTLALLGEDLAPF